MHWHLKTQKGRTRIIKPRVAWWSRVWARFRTPYRWRGCQLGLAHFVDGAWSHTGEIDADVGYCVRVEGA